LRATKLEPGFRYFSSLLLNLFLLFFDGFDQERGQAGVIHAGSVPAVLLPLYDPRNDRTHFFGDNADLVFAVRLQIVGDAAQLLDLVERTVQCVDVGLPAVRAVSRPSVCQGRP